MTKQKLTKTIEKSDCNTLKVKKILTPIILGFTSFSLLQSNVNFAATLPAALDLQAFPGINIDSPDMVDENPSSPDHSKNILLNTLTKPEADVKVNVTTDKQCTLNVTEFVYRNIDTSINLTVTAVTDGVKEESIHDCVLTFKFTSEDEKYNNITKDVTVKVKDWNLGLNVSTKRINENPTAPNHADIINFKLDDKPSGEFKLTLTTDEKQCILETKEIVLNQGNWQNGVNVKVTAVYDKIKEEPLHNCDLTVSSDANNVDMAGQVWNERLEVEDFNITMPTLVNTGAKIIAPPFIGMLLIFGIWFLALKNNGMEPVGEKEYRSFKVRSVAKREKTDTLISVARKEDGQIKLREAGVPHYEVEKNADLSYISQKNEVEPEIIGAPVGVFTPNKTTVIPVTKPKEIEKEVSTVSNQLLLPTTTFKDKGDEVSVVKVRPRPVTIIGSKPSVLSVKIPRVDRARVVF